MTAWKNAIVEWYFSSDLEMYEQACQVSISGRKIFVDYKGDTGLVVYEGEEIDSGHFWLRARIIEGEMTLHRFPTGRFLDGVWIEGGERGMLRIRLDKDY